MRILALDAALGRCAAAVTVDGAPSAERQLAVTGGEAALLPGLAASLLAEAGLRPADLDAIAATIGPGSFTGLRATLALAQGLGLAAGVPVIGVTVAEALAEAARQPAGRTLWVAIDSRRADRVFLVVDGTARAVALSALPAPPGPVAIAGDAAPLVAAWLASRGADVALSDLRRPRPADIARVARRRALGGLAPLAPRPLYVDAPAVRPAEAPLRPAPAPR